MPVIGERGASVAHFGRRVEAVGLRENERLGREITDLKAGVLLGETQSLRGFVEREGAEPVRHELEGGGRGRGEIVVEHHDVGLDEKHGALGPCHGTGVGGGRFSAHVVPLRGKTRVEDAACGGGRVHARVAPIDEHRVLGTRGVRPFVVERTAVQIAVGTGGQQTVAESVQLNAELRIVAMAAGAERSSLEEQMHVVATVEQGRMQTDNARTAEDHRLRPVGRRNGRGQRRQIDGVQKALDAAGGARTGLLEPPRPVGRRSRASGIGPFHASEVVEIRAGERTVGEVAKAGVGRVRRHDVKRKVADLVEERLLKTVDTERAVRDLHPRRDFVHVTGEIVDAFVPAAVIIRPDRIGGVKFVHGVIEPGLGLRHLTVESDGDFSDLVPDAVAVAIERTRQVAVAVTDLAALPGVGHAARPHRAETGALRLGENVVDPVVRARRTIEYGLACLAVQREVAGAVRVPRGERHQERAGRLAITRILSHQPNKGEQFDLVAGAVADQAVGPPMFDGLVVILVAGRSTMRRFRRRTLLDQVVGCFAECGETCGSRPILRGGAHPRQILRTHKEARMFFRQPLTLLSARRHRKEDRVVRDGHTPHRAPRRHLLLGGSETVAPEPDARLKRLMVGVDAPRHFFGGAGSGEVARPRPFDLVVLGTFVVDPSEGGRIHDRRRAIGRPIAPLVSVRGTVVNRKRRISRGVQE